MYCCIDWLINCLARRFAAILICRSNSLLSRSGLPMPLSRHTVGTYSETSLHATRQGTLGHSLLTSAGIACWCAGGRLHLTSHTPLTQRSQSGLTLPLSRHSVGTYPETSSHATCQGTVGHSRLSSLSYCGLILS